MAVLVARHAERVDYAVRNNEGRSWQSTAERPWDTPITDAGVKQAHALGRAVQEHCRRFGLPPVTRVFCSPLLRCVQTAAGVCDALDPPSAAGASPSLRICVEPLLRETAGEDWYRSWAVEDADGTWGGPPNCRVGIEPKLLKAEAEIRSSGADCAGPHSPNVTRGLLLQVTKHFLGCGADDWLCPDTPTLYRRLARAESGTPHSAASRLHAGYLPQSFATPMACEDGHGHSWGHFESESMQVARLGRCFDILASLYPDETVLLVSHGGPSASLFRHSQRFKPPPSGWKTCKYCGLYAMRRREGSADGSGAGWEALLEAEDGHLAAVPEAGQTSGSSAAEQAVSEAMEAEAHRSQLSAAGQCNIASVGFVALLLLLGHFNVPGNGRR